MKYDFIDFAKGLGILLVIMGHSLFPLHQAINIFHMPLFFFLAGLTLKKSNGMGQFIIKKIDRIIIPLMFFTFFSKIIEKSISYQGPIFNASLWFLWALFGGLIISQIILQTVKSRKLILIVAFVIAIIIHLIILFDFLDIIPFHLHNSITACVFILLGFCFQPLVFKTISKKNCTQFMTFFTLIYAIGLNLSVHFYKLDGASFVNNQMCSFNFGLFYMTSISGVLATIGFSKLVKHNKLINWLGKNSLIIMCVHFPFVEWLNGLFATTTLYTSYGITGKIVLGIFAYTTTILFCLPFIYIFKKYLPQFTGYNPLIMTRPYGQ